MQAADSKKTTRKVVAGLIVTAAVVCTAGFNHQKRQQDATVDWHQVSTALMEVESAKRELHQSLQNRIIHEQQTTALRQQ